MDKIAIPEKLQKLLESSSCNGSIRSFVDKVSLITDHNRLIFFPHYTDHGTAHLNAVLKSEVELVPDEVWEKSRGGSGPLTAEDAAVIIGATLLHDIGMHLPKKGFEELISPGTHFEPLPWFKEDKPDHPRDLPWPELWENYVQEAKHL